VVVFRFKDRSEERVSIGGNVPNSMGEKALIDSTKVSDS
jgi:hypothetical protein